MFLELKVSFPRIEWKAEAEQRPSEGSAVDSRFRRNYFFGHLFARTLGERALFLLRVPRWDSARIHRQRQLGLE